MILVVGAFLRLKGLNWDQGFSMHPDERTIVMISERIHWPNDGEWSKVLTPESPLNPKFFAYGSLPIYLLRFSGFIVGFFNKTLTEYGKINLVGRVFSAAFDIATILVIYLLGKRLFPGSFLKPLISALFYALSVLAIQLSHFYAVDTILNFFIWLNILLLIMYLQRPSARLLFFIGATTGLAVATKFTGVFLLPPILLTLYLTAYKERVPLLNKSTRFFYCFAFFTLIFALFTFLFMPYALIDFTTYKANLLEQLRMSNDPYVFPYTLQYVNSRSYIYPLQQIFWWGLGPLLSLLSIIGLITLTIRFSIIVYTKILRSGPLWRREWLVPAAFGISYFLIIGNSAVKFMRYYLPLYPLLSILAARLLEQIFTRTKQILGTHLTRALLFLTFLVTFIWPLPFTSIYQHPNTRYTASTWINQNIPPNSKIAIEHWDDSLPIFGQEKYKFLEMPLYEPDANNKKWETVNQNLNEADFLILASNRLYVPLTKLGDCREIKIPERCYPKTAEYYKNLFGERLGFKKVAEFTNYPRLSIINYELQINDGGADENFTVFDHPKIIIFKKT